MSYLAKVLVEEVVAWSDESYMTAFAFKNEPDPQVLHVTHKYFGALPDEVLPEVIHTIDEYFDGRGGFTPFQKLFDKEEMFGEDKDTRVLRPSNCDPNLDPDLHIELKSRLDYFAADTWPSYKPHVTTELPVVKDIIDRYVLVKGGKVLKEWRAMDGVQTSSK